MVCGFVQAVLWVVGLKPVASENLSFYDSLIYFKGILASYASNAGDSTLFHLVFKVILRGRNHRLAGH